MVTDQMTQVVIDQSVYRAQAIVMNALQRSRDVQHGSTRISALVKLKIASDSGNPWIFSG